MLLFALRCTLWILTVATMAFFVSPARAQSQIELIVGNLRHVGLKVASDSESCWLVDDRGRYEFITLADVTKFGRTAEAYRVISAGVLARELRSQYGREYDIETRKQFVVIAPSGKARAFLDSLIETEAQFKNFFQSRNWSLKTASYPFVVVVRATRAEFEQDCRDNGLEPKEEFKGFYHPLSNQIYLFDQASPTAMAGQAKISASPTRSTPKQAPSENVDKTKDVLVHEAIHLLAFNSGLHNRLGENPRWLTEGLATMLEGTALESRNRSNSSERVNAGRLETFLKFRASSPNHTIIDLISKDENFYQDQPVDFYAASWALTFYLSEVRRSDYIKYLKLVAERQSLTERYSVEARIADFQAAFGNDLRQFDTQFVRFIDGLK